MKTVSRGVPSAMIWKAGAAAAMWSAAINAAIFVMGVLSHALPAVGLMPHGAFYPALLPVVAISALGGLGGAAVYRLVLERSENPFPLFVGIAGTVMSLSLIAPLSMAGYGVDGFVLLTIMHLITAGLTVAYMAQLSPAPVPE